TGPLSLQVEGRKVVMMHEPFGLNDTIMADYIFYGHTHRIDTNLQGDRLVLNPGESCGYLTGRSTVVLLDPANRSYEVVEI
ncbi:MAG TPA: metallophosphoesterase family protein, partial [Mesotoga sp.]|nr:metallophosphoesterase family protein [Mesotoga sp.]